MYVLPFLLYLGASAAYAVHFGTRRHGAGLLATALLGGGALAHTFVVGMQTMEVGHVPLVGTTGAISAFVWLLALVYLYIELTTDERAMGTLVAPLLAALQLIPTLNPGVAERPPVLESPLFTVHVSSMLFAYAGFALAFVIGVTYVLLFKELKAKHLGFFYARLPSLEMLDVMNVRAVTAGWIFLTIGVAVGGAWMLQVRGAGLADPRVEAMSVLDPKILIALVCWGVYSFHLYARRIGWKGRRSAWLSAIGFAIVLLNFVPVGFFFTRSHNF